jgi:hypothetical protein
LPRLRLRLSTDAWDAFLGSCRRIKQIYEVYLTARWPIATLGDHPRYLYLGNKPAANMPMIAVCSPARATEFPRRGLFRVPGPRPLPAAIHFVFPPAGAGPRQGEALRRRLDAGMTKSPAVAPRLLVVDEGDWRRPGWRIGTKPENRIPNRFQTGCDLATAE